MNVWYYMLGLDVGDRRSKNHDVTNITVIILSIENLIKWFYCRYQYLSNNYVNYGVTTNKSWCQSLDFLSKPLSRYFPVINHFFLMISYHWYITVNGDRVLSSFVVFCRQQPSPKSTWLNTTWIRLELVKITHHPSVNQLIGPWIPGPTYVTSHKHKPVQLIHCLVIMSGFRI